MDARRSNARYYHLRHQAARVRVVLVYNSGAGERRNLRELKKLFTEAHIEITESIKVESGFENTLQPHIKKGAIIAAVGGDGTLSNIANLLKDTNAILMPLPGGTLNHFTKDLGVPQSLPEALRYFASAKKSQIDIGQVDGKVFINNSSIGIYSDSLFERDEHEKRYGKWPAMIIATINAFIRYRTYRVVLNGKEYSTPLVFVGNNKYLLEGLMFTRSGFHDGVLSVYVVRGTSRLNLFLALASLLRGRKNMPKKLKSFNTKEVVISTKHRLRVSRDGEYEKMPSPLRYEIKKASLWVLHRQ